MPRASDSKASVSASGTNSTTKYARNLLLTAGSKQDIVQLERAGYTKQQRGRISDSARGS